jgi:hypothetical protein
VACKPAFNGVSASGTTETHSIFLKVMCRCHFQAKHEVNGPGGSMNEAVVASP